MWIQSLALFSGLRIWRCCELCCMLQTWLGSHIYVAVFRLAAAALFQPLAWEPPCTTGVVKERKRGRDGEEGRENICYNSKSEQPQFVHCSFWGKKKKKTNWCFWRKSCLFSSQLNHSSAFSIGINSPLLCSKSDFCVFHTSLQRIFLMATPVAYGSSQARD